MTRTQVLLALDAACLTAQNDPDPEIRAAVGLLGDRLFEVIGDAFPDYGAMLDAQKESVEALAAYHKSLHSHRLGRGFRKGGE